MNEGSRFGICSCWEGTVLYPPPRSPSGLRGQSELSEDSPKSPRTVRAVRRQSEDSPRTVRAVLVKHYFTFCSDSARTLLGLCSDSARTLLGFAQYVYSHLVVILGSI